MNWHNVLLRPRNLYEELLRRKLISGGGVPAVLQTVTGISPLTLLNVASKGIKSLTQFGKCEQASTPTPSVPVDIKCNNGKLGIISEGVPIEYIRVEYLQSSGTQYIDTGVTINYATQKIEQKATVQYTTSNTNRELMGSNGYGFWGKNTSNKLESAAVTVTESALNKNTVSLITDPTNNSVTFVVNSNRYESTASTLADNYYACHVFALGGRDGAATSFFCNAKVYEYTIILDDVVVSHLIPVKRRSDGVLGMYDTVTNSFKVNAGTGTFTAGNAIGSIGVVGTPEVLTVASETTQTASVENLFGVGDYKDEQNIISGEVARKVGVRVLDGTENWTRTSSGGGSIVFSVEANAHSIQGWSEITSLCTNFECYVGDTSPTYIAANVGKFWLNTSGQYFRFVTDGTMDLAQFKAWLSAQYANGTPVIVVYPLAEATTEQVTAQHLTAKDTATITAQTNNISDITFEVEYWENAE